MLARRFSHSFADRDARAEATSMAGADLQGHAKDAANLVACGGTMARTWSPPNELSFVTSHGWRLTASRCCERVLCRGWRDEGDGGRTAMLAVLSALEHPTQGLVGSAGSRIHGVGQRWAAGVFEA